MSAASRGDGSECAEAIWRPVGKERCADDPGLWDGPPVAAVVGFITVVAHHVVVAPWDRDRLWERAADRVGARLDVGPGLSAAVPIDAATVDLQGVAEQADHALDIGLA